MDCVVPEISILPGNQKIQFAKENFEHLFELQLADNGDGSQNESSVLDVLVGSDFYWAFILDRRKRGKSGPVAIETRLGCVLSGPVLSGAVFSGEQDSPTMNFFIAAKKTDEISFEPSKFWALEGLGIDSQEEADHLDNF